MRKSERSAAFTLRLRRFSVAQYRDVSVLPDRQESADGEAA
jgi:hypothetical protein